MLKGLTNSEFVMLLQMGAAFWFPAGLLVAALLGATPLGLIAGAVMTLLTIIVGGIKLQLDKRGRPERFHVRRFKLALEHQGLRQYGFLCGGAAWQLNRQRG